MDIVYHREDEKVEETFERYNVTYHDKKKIESLLNLLDDITFNESHELFSIYEKIGNSDDINENVSRKDFMKMHEIQEEIGINVIWEKLNKIFEKYPKELKREIILA